MWKTYMVYLNIPRLVLRFNVFIILRIFLEIRCRYIFYNLMYKSAITENCVTVWSCSLTCLPVLFYSWAESVSATCPSVSLASRRIWAYSTALAAETSSSVFLAGCWFSKTSLAFWVEISWAGVSGCVVVLSVFLGSEFEVMVWQETQRASVLTTGGRALLPFRCKWTATHLTGCRNVQQIIQSVVYRAFSFAAKKILIIWMIAQW